jgi:microcompartment protein CcmK/EutM
VLSTRLPFSGTESEAWALLAAVRDYVGLPDERFTVAPDSLGHAGMYEIVLYAGGSVPGSAIDFTNGWNARGKETK